MNYSLDELTENVLLKIQNTSIKRYLLLNELKEQYLNIINDSELVKTMFFELNIQSIEYRFDEFANWFEVSLSDNDCEIFSDFFKNGDVFDEITFTKYELGVDDELDIMLFMNDENIPFPEKVVLYNIFCDIYSEESILKFHSLIVSSKFFAKNKDEFTRILNEMLASTDKKIADLKEKLNNHS